MIKTINLTTGDQEFSLSKTEIFTCATETPSLHEKRVQLELRSNQKTHTNSIDIEIIVTR